MYNTFGRNKTIEIPTSSDGPSSGFVSVIIGVRNGRVGVGKIDSLDATVERARPENREVN
jgi:hypothetical protein